MMILVVESKKESIVRKERQKECVEGCETSGEDKKEVDEVQETICMS